jgi:hypothetical protein
MKVIGCACVFFGIGGFGRGQECSWKEVMDKYVYNNHSKNKGLHLKKFITISLAWEV